MKQKSSSTRLRTGVNRRWFTIENIPMNDFKDDYFEWRSDNDTNNSQYKDEFALCYYKTPASTEKSGWIFLSDVINLSEIVVGNSCWIHINHPIRLFKLKVVNQDHHSLWLTTLQRLCGLDSFYDKSRALKDDDEKNINVFGREMKSLEPAAVTYESENVYNHDSSSPTLIAEKNHKAQMDFIRELNEPKDNGLGDSKNAPTSENIFHHNSDIVEEEKEVHTNEMSLASPLCHEIVTTTGIEQHTVLSPFKSCLSHNETHFCSSQMSLIDEVQDEHEIPRGLYSLNHPVGSYAQEIDHRLQQNDKAYIGDETICKRLGRAILEPTPVSYLVETKDGDNVVVDGATNTMVEKLSIDEAESSKECDLTSDINYIDEHKNSWFEETQRCNNAEKGTDLQLHLFQCRDEDIDGRDEDLDDNDWLDLNENLDEERRNIDSSSPDKEKISSQWDDEESLQSDPGRRRKEQFSFETDCSYLPDDNFVEEDWDNE